MGPHSKGVLVAWAQLREGMVHMAVAGLIRTHRQQQVPHGCILPKLPIVTSNVWHLVSTPSTSATHLALQFATFAGLAGRV